MTSERIDDDYSLLWELKPGHSEEKGIIFVSACNG